MKTKFKAITKAEYKWNVFFIIALFGYKRHIQKHPYFKSVVTMYEFYYFLCFQLQIKQTFSAFKAGGPL